jgi:hypothetical protein
MEILKFDDEKSPTSRKRSGRGAILVAFVAVALGAGTALASGTLDINGTSNQIQISQAVATTNQCDPSIDVGLETVLSGTAFNLSKIKVSNIDATACANKYLKIKVYSGLTGSTDLAFCATVGGDSGCFDSGKSYVKQITSSTLDFTIANPLLEIVDSTTMGRVTAEITDTDPSA